MVARRFTKRCKTPRQPPSVSRRCGSLHAGVVEEVSFEMKLMTGTEAIHVKNSGAGIPIKVTDLWNVVRPARDGVGYVATGHGALLALAIAALTVAACSSVHSVPKTA